MYLDRVMQASKFVTGSNEMPPLLYQLGEISCSTVPQNARFGFLTPR